jgi:hypothetical protein
VHRFGRGLMRSAARLTYTHVQQMHEGAAGAAIGPGTPSPLEGEGVQRTYLPPSIQPTALCSRHAPRAARSTWTCRSAR